MIDLEKLKPILEPLNLSADVLESIIAIDEADVGYEEKLKEQTDAINAEWNDRFRAAFFKGEGVPHDHEAEVTEQVDDQSKDESPETYDDLFKEGEEE